MACALRRYGVTDSGSMNILVDVRRHKHRPLRLELPEALHRLTSRASHLGQPRHTFFTTTNGSAPVRCIGILPHEGCSLVISLGINAQVPTFRIKACIGLMPPLHRLPSGQ
ncbi:MAG: hypothetical protein P8X74_21215 [Reinekea sp.]